MKIPTKCGTNTIILKHIIVQCSISDFYWLVLSCSLKACTPFVLNLNAGSCSIDLCNGSTYKDKARRHWKVSNASTALHMSPLPCHSLIFQLESHALCIFLPDQNALLALNTGQDAICFQEVFLCLTHIFDFIEP